MFLYVSDHGDMNGCKGYFGKQVFYEPSVHIPFLIQGDGIPAGRRITSPVSLLDVGPTVCDLAGVEVLPGDGKSLVPLLRGCPDDGRMTVSEQYTYLCNGETSLGRMVRWKNWKFFTYHGFPEADCLFDLDSDPEERNNRIGEYPNVAEKMRQAFTDLKTYEQVMEHENWVVSQLRLLMACDYEDTQEHWQCPEDMEVLSDPIHRKEPFKPTAWAPLMMKRIRSSEPRP